MNFNIKRFEQQDETALFDLMRSDDWTDYSGNNEAMEKYKLALHDCIVYVGYKDNTLCGFIRAKDDYGYGIYIYDLLVHKNYRGNSYGRLLIERVCKDYPGTVYVMSGG